MQLTVTACAGPDPAPTDPTAQRRFELDATGTADGEPVVVKATDVKADSGASFASRTFGHHGTFSYTPTRAGVIKYECTLHPGMTGKLTVVAR